jgi:hypothetical protein
VVSLIRVGSLMGWRVGLFWERGNDDDFGARVKRRNAR